MCVAFHLQLQYGAIRVQNLSEEVGQYYNVSRLTISDTQQVSTQLRMLLTMKKDLVLLIQLDGNLALSS